ncbi:MAG: hypothetical protein FJY17_08325 [Bacteroidetes bacterium]|nr:hypothetical protein [Bacteroidota bacterium]
MKTVLFVGASSDVALESKKLLESQGNSIICITRQSTDRLPNALLGSPVDNNLPEIDFQIDGLVYFPGSITLKPFRSLKQTDFQQELEVNVLGAINAIQKYSSKLNEASNRSLVGQC